MVIFHMCTLIVMHQYFGLKTINTKKCFIYQPSINKQFFFSWLFLIHGTTNSSPNFVFPYNVINIKKLSLKHSRKNW
jgi:hypothetical protein